MNLYSDNRVRLADALRALGLDAHAAATSAVVDVLHPQRIRGDGYTRIPVGARRLHCYQVRGRAQCSVDRWTGRRWQPFESRMLTGTLAGFVALISELAAHHIQPVPVALADGETETP